MVIRFRILLKLRRVDFVLIFPACTLYSVHGFVVCIAAIKLTVEFDICGVAYRNRVLLRCV
jgi:hypothetical protein